MALTKTTAIYYEFGRTEDSNNFIYVTGWYLNTLFYVSLNDKEILFLLILYMTPGM